MPIPLMSPQLMPITGLFSILHNLQLKRKNTISYLDGGVKFWSTGTRMTRMDGFYLFILIKLFAKPKFSKNDSNRLFCYAEYRISGVIQVFL